MSSPLTDAMAASRAADRRKAARALLRRPLLRADGAEADAFVLVARYARELRQWFDRETGWRLQVNTEVARLLKAVPDLDDHTHPAIDPGSSKQPFGRRRYVLTCLALAALERADTQITLGRLAEQVMLATAEPALAEAGVTFTLERRDERSDLVAVARLLLNLGVLTRVAGDEQSFVDRSADVLYDVRRRVTSSLLTTARGPSVVRASTLPERLAEATAELEASTDELRNRRIRFRLTRILLDAPVLYYDRLDEDERAYLSHQRGAICARITEFTGLIAEVRAEGIAMVDPADDLTDVRMPEVGTDGHVALMIAGRLAAAPGARVPLSELHAWIAQQAGEFVRRNVWRRTAAEVGAERELTHTALGKLEALRLIERSPRDDPSPWVRPLPAIARYGLAEPTVVEPKRSETEKGTRR